VSSARRATERQAAWFYYMSERLAAQFYPISPEYTNAAGMGPYALSL